MGLIDELPVAAPFQPKSFTDLADLGIIGMFTRIFGTVLAENPDIESGAEIVIGLTGPRLGNDRTRLVLPWA